MYKIDMEGRDIPLWVTGMRQGRYHYYRGGEYMDRELPHFNVDHPFRVGRRSFVCYPYHINVEDIEPLRLFLKKRDYKLLILAHSEYSSITLKIVFLHKKDEGRKLDFSEIENRVKDNKLYWKQVELREKIHRKE